MKKMLTGLFVVALVAGSVYADSRTVTLIVTQGQAIAYSDPVVCAGTLDKIEVVQTTPGTATVTIATYGGAAGTTAIDTFASLSSLATATKLVRPSFLPTANTGTDLAAAYGGELNTNVAQQLVIPYRPALLGGNVKMAVTAGNCSLTAHTVTATIYYTPFK